MERAAEILAAIQSNRMLPSKAEIKRMISSDKWRELGKLFQFEPQFLLSESGSGKVIDWRCVPETMADILRSQQNPSETKRVMQALGIRKIKRRRSHPKEREETYSNQSGICYYCEKHTLFAAWSIDHKTPLSRGGSNRSENKVGACKTCNWKKACLTETEFMTFDPRDTHSRKKKIREVTELRFAELRLRMANAKA